MHGEFVSTRIALVLRRMLLIAGLAAAMGCGGGGAPPESSTLVPSQPVLAVGVTGVKQLRFSWSSAKRASSYRFYEAVDGSTFVQVGADRTDTAYELSTSLHRIAAARYRVDACNPIGCTASEPIAAKEKIVDAIGYFKPSNTRLGDVNANSGDRFGHALAVSSDGNTLAVGACGDVSGAKGINGNPNDNSAPESGAVFVFVRSNGTWTQQAYLKASNTGSTDCFGYAVSISSDGNTLAVSAPWEDGSATGVGGAQDDLSGDTGAVYVFVRSGTAWSQQAYVKASNTGGSDYFGLGLALSGDGNVLAVGAPHEASAAKGVNVNSLQTDNSLLYAGAVYVFARSGTTWSQQAYVKASNTDSYDNFGRALALNANGNTLAIGAAAERSSAKVVNGDQTDNSLTNAGAVYLLARVGTAWIQQAYVKPLNTGANDGFGTAVALTADGQTLAVGAPGEGSNATGVDGVDTDDSMQGAGAAYVFTNGGSGWGQRAYLKVSTAFYDSFGSALAFSADGSTLAIGAPRECSAAVGVGGAETPFSAAESGAVYVFDRTGLTWLQSAYVKASNTDGRDAFGSAVGLSADGSTLAVGAYEEQSIATGIDGVQADDTAYAAGAVYLY